jgi:sugar (pentulose or hexulose) kinase
VSELLLGVDIGTSSSKGVLARPDGEVVATAQREHELSLPRPGWAEHDAEGVWWADFVSICGKLLEKADDGIAAVCTSGIGACLLPADEEGRPLRCAIFYGIDTRATREIEELSERYGEKNLLSRCGSVLTTQALGPKRLAQPDTDWSRVSATVEPKAENRQVYDELYRVYRDLYPATREQVHKLADTQKVGAATEA